MHQWSFVGTHVFPVRRITALCVGTQQVLALRLGTGEAVRWPTEHRKMQKMWHQINHKQDTFYSITARTTECHLVNLSDIWVSGGCFSRHFVHVWMVTRAQQHWFVVTISFSKWGHFQKGTRVYTSSNHDRTLPSDCVRRRENLVNWPLSQANTWATGLGFVCLVLFLQCWGLNSELCAY
jgi:hypothetical protein